MSETLHYERGRRIMSWWEVLTIIPTWSIALASFPPGVGITSIVGGPLMSR